MRLEQAQKIFPPEFVAQLNRFLINGNYGDFVTARDGVAVVEYLLKCNPTLQVEISTNASARPDIWETLGKLGVSIDFRIDGLADTHALYRQDTNFDNIMRNAETFVAAGGNAIWSINEFEHNQSQMPEVHALANKIGFSDVQVRPTTRDNGPVYNRRGQKVAAIKSDWGWPDQLDQSFIEIKVAQQQQIVKNKKTVKIACWAIRERSVYMAADGHVYPCCWTGHNPAKYRSHTALSAWNTELGKYIAHNHAPTVGVEAALDWFDNLSASWRTDDQPGVCQHNCQHDNTNTNSSP
jgi:sulfatase maturation enzyme AslB (radical SAM superfamily)